MSFLLCLVLTCNGDEPVIPPTDGFDHLRPTISTFTAYRTLTAITDGLVYGGEDVRLAVEAVSHALPASCGLDEGEVIGDNLTYTFSSIPPQGIQAPGLFSQASTPPNEAMWRVPDLTEYDNGEGLIYVIKVLVYDECLDTQSTGSLTLRAFANQGMPDVTNELVEGKIGAGVYTTQLANANGLYEIEKGNEWRISITALSRTLRSVCSNRGVAEGKELLYSWNCANPSVELSSDLDPTIASIARFTVSGPIQAGTIFDIEGRIEDACTGTSVTRTYSFIVIEAPRITSLTGTANGVNLTYDTYFDTYTAVPGDKVVLTATAESKDENLCVSKGISPVLDWSWEETNGTIPVIAPDFEQYPTPYNMSSIDFVVPVAPNGTEYVFKCTVLDRCCGLEDFELARLMIIVPPTATIDFVHLNMWPAIPALLSGRYEVRANDRLDIRVSALEASDTAFCGARGISIDPPIQYTWSNPWNMLVLDYDSVPSTAYCDLSFYVPSEVVPVEVDLHCVVKDLCNGLTGEVVLPFSVIEGPE
jgi:hypothetical protein